MQDFTRLLQAIDSGEKGAGELFPLVYGELKQIAGSRLQALKPGETLQPTVLVHEAYLRLFADSSPKISNRKHFFCLAAEAMRCIIIEELRRKQSLKRGGGDKAIELRDIHCATTSSVEEVLSVNEALEALAIEDATCAELVKLRYFAGLEMGECAQLLEISESTAHRYWRFAKAFLKSRLI